VNRWVSVGLLASTIACAKVTNPFYVDELGDEASGTAGETEATSSDSSDSTDTSSSTDSTDSSSSETDSADSSSSSDTDCPPSESGCPCLEGTQCFPGLTCIDNVCLAPDDCMLEDPDVRVQWSYDVGGMQPPAVTNCTVSAAMQDTGLALTIGGCEDGVTSLGIVLDPLPPGLVGAGILGLAGAPVGVRLHFEQGGAFVRLVMPGYDLWLVEGGLVASGDAAVSDYPGEVVALVGECPGEPKFCGNEVGELKRRGVRMLGQPVFDGSMLIDISMVGWVDLARVDCGLPQYRFAIVDWP
jgi:hypothetical protein